ncbi:hypothetical protein SAMN05920897_1323 [Alkalispirochaeta americana]|uniref:Pycsar effector protein domain-containing protein n=1 Tax=Alkalispirochaeta americana TaxID=159291 RepID=A0A1N6XVW0_9SPIO|nr:Pycsar system effector family protein [Alkalispirochaeta americana]SIR06414.1 hypothetical protein SAMN05920897_1323 [Alkalispirochaeta americana]
MISEEEQKVENNLMGLYVSINEWLKYAEAKNAILLPIFIAIFLGVLTILLQITITNICLKIYLYNILIFTALGVFSTVLSFYPNLKRPFLFKGNKSNNDNLLYFGDIQKYTVLDFETAYYEKYSINEKPKNSFAKEYINQIIINSKITYTKFTYFKIGVFLLLSAFISIVISFLIVLFLSDK